MNSNTIIGVVVVIIIALGAWWYFSHDQGMYGWDNNSAMMNDTDASNTAAAANAQIQGRDNSDASLNQDIQAVDAQMGQFNTDASAAASAGQ